MEEPNGPAVAKKTKYVLGLDVGTTTVSGSVFDSDGGVHGQYSKQLTHVCPKPGWVEMDPEELWKTVVEVLRNTLAVSGLKSDELTCMGVCTQRATFITWDKHSGKEFHNFIVWKDSRADESIQQLNRSLPMKLLRSFGSSMYLFTRKKVFKFLSIFNMPLQITVPKMQWVLENNAAVRNAVSKDNCVFGTVETWLLHKATLEKPHFAELGNLVATALINPSTGTYMPDYFLRYFGIQPRILPAIVDSVGSHLGSLDPAILGTAVPIRSLMSDVGAALVGSGGTKRGQSSLTIGTGSFLVVNLEEKSYQGYVKDVFPSIAYSLKKEIVFSAEDKSLDTSLILEWAKKMDMFDNVSDSSEIAEKSWKNNIDMDLYFVPGFCGLHAPFNDPMATAGLIGLTEKTTQADMLRALLEAIAFTMNQMIALMNEKNFNLQEIQVSGGVSKNDFVLQLTSTLSGRKLHRSCHSEKAAFGAAFMAGLDAGVWATMDQLSKLIRTETTFLPEENPEIVEIAQSRYKKWIEACKRCTKWNQ